MGANQPPFAAFLAAWLAAEPWQRDVVAAQMRGIAAADRAEIRPTAASLRPQVEQAIEGLISLLDDMDGDADMECNGDLEPSLGVGLLWSPATGWTNTSADLEGQDASDEPDDSTDPQTMNPAPIRAKRIATRKAA